MLTRKPKCGGEMRYGCLGWQRGQKKFVIIVTVQFYFKFENVICLVLSVQRNAKQLHENHHFKINCYVHY